MPLLLLAAVAALNPYAPRPTRPSAALIYDAVTGRAGSGPAIEAWLRRHPTAPKVERRELQHALCNVSGATGGPAFARACHAATRLGASDGDDAAIADLLAREAPLRVSGAARVPLTRNAYGTRSVRVGAGGTASDWIFDTGAEMTVVSESLAREMGVRMIGGGVTMNTSTNPVASQVGMIDRLRIGDGVAEHVPVIVLPDAQLTIGSLPPIRGILGLPLMVKFGRVGLLDHGATLTLGTTTPVTAPTGRIYWHESGVGVSFATAAGTRGAHLDSGANSSTLHTDGVALLPRADVSAAAEHSFQVGGAGGMVDAKQKVVPRFSARIAGAPVTLTRIAIDPAPEPDAAVIGYDALEQFGTFVLDFTRMTVAARR